MSHQEQHEPGPWDVPDGGAARKRRLYQEIRDAVEYGDAMIHRYGDDARLVDTRTGQVLCKWDDAKTAIRKMYDDAETIIASIKEGP